jgi:amidase
MPLAGPTEESRALTFREYADFDGLGLAELVARGEITSAELIEEAISRAERHNPTINALVYEMYDSARDAARETDSNGVPAPFRGVPFLLKDLLGNCTGVPTTCASRFLDGVPANHDSELVIRFRRAGLIPIGKTNSPSSDSYQRRNPTCTGPAGTRGTPIARQEARVGVRPPLWRPESFPLLTRATEVAPSEFRRLAVASWG